MRWSVASSSSPEDGQPGIGESERMLARDWYLLLVSEQHGRADIGRSRAYLEEALKSFPKDAHLTLALGADHEMLSDQSAGYVTYFDTEGRIRRQSEVDADDELREAIRYMEQAVALDPKQVEGRLRLGRLLYRRGELDHAAQELDAARQLTSQHELRYLALLFRGMVEAARGQLRSSRQPLHRRPPPNPNRADSRHRKGRNCLPSWPSGRSRCHHPGDVAADEEGRPVVGLRDRASGGTSSIGSSGFGGTSSNEMAMGCRGFRRCAVFDGQRPAVSIRRGARRPWTCS